MFKSDDPKIEKIIFGDPYEDANLEDSFSSNLIGKKVKVSTIFGELVFTGFGNGEIANFLDEQWEMGGSRDLQCPIISKTNEYVIVYVGDGASGNHLIITPIQEYNKKQICEVILDITGINDLDDEWDEYDDF